MKTFGGYGPGRTDIHVQQGRSLLLVGDLTGRKEAQKKGTAVGTTDALSLPLRVRRAGIPRPAPVASGLAAQVLFLVDEWTAERKDE